MKTILLFILLIPTYALADSLNEQQMQEYINATAQGEDIPNADVTEEDAVEGPIVTMHEVGSIFSGSNGIETPQLPTNIIPEPAPIDVNTLSAQWYFEAYKQRAIREGKPEMYYVNIAIASSIKAKEIQKKAERDQFMCDAGFEIYPDSQICNKFSSHVEAEQNYYHCALNNYQLALRNGELEAKCGYGVPVGKPCDDKGWGGPNVWKAKSEGRSGGVVILDRKYCDGNGGALISDLSIENEVGMSVASVKFRQCDAANAGRYHLDFNPEGKKLTGPVYVRYNYNGVSECRKVNNPAVDQR
jgi:hypothetical protein